MHVHPVELSINTKIVSVDVLAKKRKTALVQNPFVQKKKKKKVKLFFIEKKDCVLHQH